MSRPTSPAPLTERISQLEKRSGNRLGITKGSMRRRSMIFDEKVKIEVSDSDNTTDAKATAKTEHRRVVSADMTFPSTETTATRGGLLFPVPGAMSRTPSRSGLDETPILSVRERRRSYIELTQAQSAVDAVQSKPKPVAQHKPSKPKAIPQTTSKATTQPKSKVTPPPGLDAIIQSSYIESTQAQSAVDAVRSTPKPAAQPKPSEPNAISQTTSKATAQPKPEVAPPPGLDAIIQSMPRNVAPPMPEPVPFPAFDITTPPTPEVIAYPNSKDTYPLGFDAIVQSIPKMAAPSIPEPITFPTLNITAPPVPEIVSPPTPEVVSSPTSVMVSPSSPEVITLSTPGIIAPPITGAIVQPTPEVSLLSTSGILAQFTSAAMTQFASMELELTIEVDIPLSPGVNVSSIITPHPVQALAPPTLQLIPPPTHHTMVVPRLEIIPPTPEVISPPDSEITSPPTIEDTSQLKPQSQLVLDIHELGGNVVDAQGSLPSSPRCWSPPVSEYCAENQNDAFDGSDTGSVLSPEDGDNFDEAGSHFSDREPDHDEGVTDDFVKDAFTSMSRIRESNASLDEKLERLKKLGGFFWKKFQEQQVLADLEDTILVERQLVNLAPDDHIKKPFYLKNFSTPLQKRFKLVGDFVDHDHAILSLQQAVELAPDDQVNKASWLNELSSLLFVRYKRLKDAEDFNNAIIQQRQAVKLAQDENDKKTIWLIKLSNWLEFRFKRLKDPADLSDAISFRQQAVDLTIDDPSQRSSGAARLGSMYLIRFRSSGNRTDLNKAVDSQRLAMTLSPNDHPDKPSLLDDLGTSLRLRFRRFGEGADINLAVDVQRQAVDLTPDDHPRKASYLNHLGMSFETRFRHQGKMEDLDNAILSQQRAADLTPDDRREKPMRLTNLADVILIRYRRSKNVAELTTAINAQRQAVALTPDTHPDRLSKLVSLGKSLETRLQSTGDSKDLNEVISIQRQMIDLVLDGQPEKPDWLTSLGRLLLKRLKQAEERGDSLSKPSADLDDAIIAQRHAAILTRNDLRDKPIRLHSLGSSLEKRFKRLGDIADSDDAIASHQQAVDLAKDDYPDKPSWLSNLSLLFFARYQRSHNSADLDSAIASQRQAAKLTPDSHSKKATRIHTFSTLLERRLERSPNPEDRANLISTFRQFTLNISDSTADRYRAARRWARLAYPDLEPYHTIFALIPRLLWFGKATHERYGDLKGLESTLSEAVSAACSAGKRDLALEWLEQGRTFIWGQILLLPSPVDDLRAAYPEIAQELSSIAHALDTTSMDHPKPDKASTTPKDEAQTDVHPADRWVALITQIRGLPNFANFLRSKSALVLESGAYDGPIVLINVSARRSDAIILQPKSSSVGTVRLSALTPNKLKAAKEQLASLLNGPGSQPGAQKSSATEPVTSSAAIDVLEMLWMDVVKPILGALRCGPKFPRVKQLVHITWCLTGELAGLPLHAAGIYQGSDKGEKLFNYAISSYTPSLTILLESLVHPSSTQPNILAIARDSASPHLPTLPGAKREVDKVEGIMEQFDLSIMRMNGEQGNVSGVLEAMGHHSWIHFACPGTTDTEEPTKSAFHLHDGRLELGAIMKQPLKHAELAILSKCQTVQSRGKLPDEAIHLPAGMFFAGYRSVVATLWSASATDTPLVAQEFYLRLLQHQEEGVASALHHAVASLRGVNGEDDILSWAPYIHIGC